MLEALPDRIEEVINQYHLYSDTSDTATVLAHKRLDVLIEMPSDSRSVLNHATEPE
jgi:hypothetical protein